MVKQICIFEHKIGYNLASIGDTSQIFVSNWGFSGLANLMASLKFDLNDLCCHSNKNVHILLQDSGICRTYKRGDHHVGHTIHSS